MVTINQRLLLNEMTTPSAPRSQVTNDWLGFDIAMRSEEPTMSAAVTIPTVRRFTLASR